MIGFMPAVGELVRCTPTAGMTHVSLKTRWRKSLGALDSE
jgi:hypothetical protein